MSYDSIAVSWPLSVGAVEGTLFLDPQRCIGCRACVEACSECPSHAGHSMIHLDTIARATSVQTSPTVCMHCEEPACMEVCPADAIQKGPDGVVHTAMTERCIGCNNCVLACPFGVPKYEAKLDLMMKCDFCYDRTSVGMKPMCATVCPSGAITYGKREEVETLRSSRAVNTFQFGQEIVRTKMHMMLPVEVGMFRMNDNGGTQVSIAQKCLDEAADLPPLSEHLGFWGSAV